MTQPNGDSTKQEANLAKYFNDLTKGFLWNF